MSKTPKDNEYYAFAVARVRVKETTLLDSQALEALSSMGSEAECIQFLLEHGWGPADDGVKAEVLLKTEAEKCWKFVREVLTEEQMKYFDLFKINRDFHNLKAAVKEAYVQKNVPDIYMEKGSVDIDKLKACALENDFSGLTRELRDAGREAREILYSTGDSQVCDCIIDRAALEAMAKSAVETGNKLLSDYAELKCASADISIAVRGAKAGKDEKFLERALAPCRTLDVDQLKRAAVQGPDQVFEYLEGSVYADAVPIIKEGGAGFDIWCDNRMTELIKPQKYNPFTVSPVVAYVIAKETEIKSVRIILTGKINQLPQEKIRERIRKSYV